MPTKFNDLALDAYARIESRARKLQDGYAACLHCSWQGQGSRTNEDGAVITPCPICSQPRCERCAEYYQDNCPLR